MKSYNQSRERLFGLLMECPHIKPGESCVLDKCRCVSLQERAKFAFETVSDEEMKKILMRHDYCSTRRDLDLYMASAEAGELSAQAVGNPEGEILTGTL